MQPLDQDLDFTFRCADDRIIPRFHRQGTPGWSAAFCLQDRAGDRGKAGPARDGNSGRRRLGGPAATPCREGWRSIHCGAPTR
jgi:hypothetical protein